MINGMPQLEFDVRVLQKTTQELKAFDPTKHEYGNVKTQFKEYVDRVCGPYEIFGDCYHASDVMEKLNPESFSEELLRWVGSVPARNWPSYQKLLERRDAEEAQVFHTLDNLRIKKASPCD